MTDPAEPPGRRRELVRAVAEAIAVRLVALVGAAALVFLFFGDIRSLIGPSAPTGMPKPSSRQTVDRSEPAATSDRGWPHLRGPDYNAISAEGPLADSWPPAGPPVLWTLELGQGYSALVAVGDRVYTQRQNLYVQSVVCLDAESGRQIWEHRYGWLYDAAGMHPGPRATPTWHAGRVYFSGPRGLVGCLRAEDGQALWSVNVVEKFGGRGHDFGYACSPLVEDGMVILPVGGKEASVVALNVDDGSTVWASGSEPASYCSAIPISLRGRRSVVAFLQNALALFDLRTGRLLWQQKYSQGYNEHAAQPMYEEPHLMITCPFQSGSELYRLEVDQSASADDRPPEVSATSVWWSKQMSNDVASSILLDGYVYGFDLRDMQSKGRRPSRGQFKCMELKTGKVLWSTDRVGHAAGIAADGKLLLFNDKGEVLLVRASPTRYEELARTEVFGGEICWTAPTLHGGRLYLRTPTKAACLYVGKAEHLSEEQLRTARSTSEIPKSKRLDLAWLVGGEREFPYDPSNTAELNLWYAFSVGGVFAVAAVLALLVRWIVQMKWPGEARCSGRVVFWSVAFVLGVAATPVYNRLWDEFVFTLPVSLFTAHQLTLMVIIWANRQAGGRKAQWISLAATLTFLSVCLGYFHICRSVGLAMQWVFLIGLLPSWPIAVPAARSLLRKGHPWRDVLWALLSFSAYFWASGAFVIWVMHP